MILSMDCHKAKTIVLQVDIASWPMWHDGTNSQGSTCWDRWVQDGAYMWNYFVDFDGIVVGMYWEVVDDYGVPNRTYKVYIVTTIGATTNVSSPVTVLTVNAAYGSAAWYTWDISMTGSFTIELDAMHLWETYVREAAEHAYGQSVEDATGYPTYPYYTGDHGVNPTWSEGEMSGHEMSIAEYVWRYGGESTGYSDTIVTIDGSMTMNGVNVPISDTGTIDTGDVHDLSLSTGIANINENFSPDAVCEMSAVLKGTGADLPYRFDGIDWEDAFNPDIYDNVVPSIKIEGTDAGVLKLTNNHIEDSTYTLYRPHASCTVKVYPELQVAANGRVNPIGASVWPDSTEYPKAKMRPLWYYYDDPDYASIELTAGVYSAALELQRIDFDAALRSRSDQYASQLTSEYQANQHNLGIVLEPTWLASAKQHTGSWRVMSQDAWLTKPCKVKHKESGTPPLSAINLTNWDLTNGTGTGNNPETGDLRVVASGAGATLTKTFATVDDEWSFSEYRYLQFMASAAAACDLTLRLTFEVGVLNDEIPRAWEWTEHTKSWTLPVTTSASLLEADLVAPDATSESRVEYDTTTWAHDKTTHPDDTDEIRSPGQVTPLDDGTDDEMAFVPNHLFGVGRVKKAEILIPASKTVYFLGSQTPLRLHTKYFAAANEVDRAMLTVLPVFQLSDTVGAEKRWTYYDTYTQTWELDPEWWKFHPDGKRLVSALVNYKQCLDLPYAYCLDGAYRQTAFFLMSTLLARWLKNGSQDWELTDVYDTDEDNPYRLNAAYPSLALSPCKWTGSTCTPIREIDVFTAAYELEARLPCDIIQVTPGTGDPQGSNTSYPYYFYTELGARFQGLTHKKTTLKAYPGAKVSVYRGATKVNDYTSNRWAYWKSDPLHTLTSENEHTVNYTGMTVPVAMHTWTRRYQWVSLIGLLASTGVIALSGFQEPLSRKECVFAPDTANENKVTLFRVNRTLESQSIETIVISDAEGLAPKGLLEKDGSQLCYFHEGGVNKQALSTDHWASFDTSDLPEPDVGSYSLYKYPCAHFIPERAAGYDASGNRIVGHPYVIALGEIDETTGAILSVPVGNPTQEANPWSQWHLNTPAGADGNAGIPAQRIEIVRRPDGLARMFYHTGTSGAWVIRSYVPIADANAWNKGAIDGGGWTEGGLHSESNVIVSSSTHKQASVIWDTKGGHYLAVTWKEDGTLHLWSWRWLSKNPSEHSWEVKGPVSLAACRLSGDTPGSDLTEQQVAFFLNSQAELRCYWWEDALKSATLEEASCLRL